MTELAAPGPPHQGGPPSPPGPPVPSGPASPPGPASGPAAPPGSPSAASLATPPAQPPAPSPATAPGTPAAASPAASPAQPVAPGAATAPGLPTAAPQGSAGDASPAPPTTGVDLALLRWHIERYDRLRASTASRAAVVLSAGAILSAGNAVVLSQVFGGSYDDLNRWLVTAFTLAVMISAAMVVVSIIRAASVLVTPRASRSMFTEPTALPPSLLFNGPDTVARAHSFEAFRTEVAGLTEADMLTAAQVELYIGIRQHRHRYGRLRDAVRLLRHSAVAFLLVLAAGVTVTTIGRF